MFKHSSHFIVFILFLGAPLFADSGRWVQLYVDCLCFTGKAEQCVADLKDRNLVSAEELFTVPGGPLEPGSDKEISKMHTAQIILETQLRAENRACLSPKLEDLKAAIHYAMFERNRLKLEPQLRSQSFGVIAGLARLSKQIYTRAYDECLKPSGTVPFAKYEALLPDPAQCAYQPAE